MTKSVYITGCFGFIGSYVTRECLNKGWHVYGIDKMTYASSHWGLREYEGSSRYKHVNVDICDKKRVKEIFFSLQYFSIEQAFEPFISDL